MAMSEVDYLNIGRNASAEFIPNAGDVYYVGLRTGAGFTSSAGQTGKKFPQVVYNVSNVNSVVIEYTAAYTGNRGSVGCEIDGVYDTVCADGASSTSTQSKTYSLVGKKSLILYGNEDNGTVNWGNHIGIKCTFS